MSGDEAGLPDQDLWALTLEHSPVGMCLATPEGRMWMPNRAFEEMIGYRREDLVEMTFHQITHPEDLAEDLVLFRETLRGERSGYRVLKRYLHADGREVWGDLSVALLRAADGTPRHFICQIVDVTAQREDRERLKQALAAVERERRLSEAMLDTVDVGLLLVDREGRPERVNRRQRHLVRMAYPGGARGGPSLAAQGHLFDEDGTTPLVDGRAPVPRAVNGEEFDDDLIWVGPDPATRRALSVSARTVHDDSGAAVGAALAFSDVTVLVQALRAREVLERSVSHELRTPLTSVLGYLELVRESDGLDEVDRRRLDVVQRNAERLDYLVSDLLDPASRGRDAIVLVRERTDVAALARDVVESVRPAGLAAHVEVGAEAPDVALAHVDPQRVRQVVENLLLNAVKYTDAGGRAVVRVEADEHEVVVTVTDTGIGIAAEDLDRVFEPFFRADTARERATPGVGLGLGIARSIVAAHGGTIEVRSAPGQGARFVTTLPVRSGAEGPETPEGPEDPAGREETEDPGFMPRGVVEPYRT